MAALGGEVSLEQAVRGFPGGYGLPKLAQKEGETMLMLTEGLWWPELRLREVVGEVRRRDVAELGKRVEAGVRRAPRLHESTRGAPAAAVGRSAWPEQHRQ